MRHAIVRRPGDFDRLRVEEAPDPTPGPGEVLVESAACGVNFADCVVRMGLYESAKHYVGWPIVPGFEVAGTVTAVGDGVTRVRVGDEVIAATRFGGYASHVVVPEGQTVPRPTGLDVLQAAAFTVAHLTAWWGLKELGNARAGSTVLVHSAAGGVGTALVQLGRILSCRVVGVVGAPHKRELVTEMGADAVIDRSTEDLWSEAERLSPEGYDVILDANGLATLGQSYAHLAPAGRLVVYGFHTMMTKGSGRRNWAKLGMDWLRTPRFNPLDMTNRNRGVLGFNLSYLFDHADRLREVLLALFDKVGEGHLRPVPIQAFPLEEAAEAHRALQSGQTTGKVVLTV